MHLSASPKSFEISDVHLFTPQVALLPPSFSQISISEMFAGLKKIISGLTLFGSTFTERRNTAEDPTMYTLSRAMENVEVTISNIV